MIGRLRGALVQQGLDGQVIVDVAGVGYEVFVPLGAVGRLAAEGTGPDNDVTLHIHTHVREDALVLYGFDSAEDKSAFRALLTVNSIGPKLALAILSAMNAPAISQAIATDDKAAFKGISGVGRKTVERILLDLKGKLLFVGEAGGVSVRSATRAPTKAAPTGVGAQVVGALVQMGYKRPDAERAVEQVLGPDAEGSEESSKPLEVALREALIALS